MKATRLVSAFARSAALSALGGCLLFGHQALVAAASGSALSGIGGSDFASVTQADLQTLAASDLMLVGPTEVVDYNAGSLQVLGQTVRLSGSGNTYRSLRRALLRVQPGSVVEVRGRLLGVGKIEATTLSVSSRPNVAGAQSLFLRGIVGALNRSIGRLAVGRLIVDYTGALHSVDSLSLRVGSEFVAIGIQASPSGSLIALSAVANGIGGSDLDGIGGSDLSGIGGSDLTGIGGSDLTGIGGSDLTGIGGSDLTGIGGSDLTGIGGSDLTGIGGSDLSGIGGSDLSGIGGSDLTGIGGSDLTGIGGSDLTGIGGSDF